MSKLSKEDIEDFKRYFFVNLPVKYLEAAINEDESILHEARQWGWSDSVVRDEISVAIERIYSKPIEEVSL